MAAAEEQIEAAILAAREEARQWKNLGQLRPEFSGSPDEDAEAHLLRVMDWLNHHEIDDDAQKVRRFPLTLTGTARRWLQTLPDDTTWQNLLARFRREFSSVGYTRERQLLEWKTMSWRVGKETIDQYVQRMTDCITALGLPNPNEMILQNLKITIPSKYFHMLMNIDNLEDAKEVLRRAIESEKIEQQMTGQQTFPYMQLSEMTKVDQLAYSQDNSKPVKEVKVVEDLSVLSDKVDKLADSFRNMGTTQKYKPRVYRDRSRERSSSRERSRTPVRGERRSRSQSSDMRRDRNRSSSRERIRCYQCHQFGHFARDCGHRYGRDNSFSGGKGKGRYTGEPDYAEDNRKMFWPTRGKRGFRGRGRGRGFHPRNVNSRRGTGRSRSVYNSLREHYGSDDYSCSDEEDTDYEGDMYDDYDNFEDDLDLEDSDDFYHPESFNSLNI